jgi:hypothetical protein
MPGFILVNVSSFLQYSAVLVNISDDNLAKLISFAAVEMEKYLSNAPFVPIYFVVDLGGGGASFALDYEIDE